MDFVLLEVELRRKLFSHTVHLRSTKAQIWFVLSYFGTFVVEECLRTYSKQETSC